MSLTMRQWRKAKELSQEYMAKGLGIHVNTYINWEKEPEKISIENSRKIADLLSVPIDDIQFRKEGT